MSQAFKRTGFAQGINEVSVTQQERLGTFRILEDGRKFRYASIAATIGCGKLAEAAAIGNANIIAQTLPTIAVGAKTFVYTAGANTTYIADYFVDGWVQVSEGTGAGQQWVIAGSTATAGASKLTTITLDEGIGTATATADSKGSLFGSFYKDVILAATITNPPVGVATQALAADNFAWLQTGGHACILFGANTSIGEYCIAHSTDGSVAIRGGAETSYHIGYVCSVNGATTKYYPIWLTLD